MQELNEESIDNWVKEVFKDLTSEQAKTILFKSKYDYKSLDEAGINSLAAEGIRNEIAHLINIQRKELNLNLLEKVRVCVSVSKEWEEPMLSVLYHWVDDLKAECFVSELTLIPMEDNEGIEHSLEGVQLPFEEPIMKRLTTRDKELLVGLEYAEWKGISISIKINVIKND